MEVPVLEMVAAAAVREAMRTTDGEKPTLGYIRRRVTWRLRGLVGQRRRGDVLARALTSRDEEELGGPADETTREVDDRDEREVLTGWLGRQGRDGEIAERSLAGSGPAEIAADMGLSERQVRRVLSEILAVARGRFRG